MNSFLSFHRVSCHKGKAAQQTQILKQLSFSVEEGEIVSLLGTSGAGKTTILRLIVGLDSFSKGEIQYMGRPLREMDVVALRREIGFVAQLPHLFPGTVAENLLFAPTIHKQPIDDRQAFVGTLLDRVGLPKDMASRITVDLSVGQQMRVSLARTLANQPKMLLLDEPTASLDRASAAQILSLIRELNQQQGLTIMAVTHDLNAVKILDGRSLFLHQGQIVEQGPSQTILNQPQSAILQDFLEGNVT
ncbi:ATP-binding cassette domain-containing protein [bacterium]|nr:ATP-binding cassette domain-containing protein [bacterium]